jgi:hypothetical protein
MIPFSVTVDISIGDFACGTNEILEILWPRAVSLIQRSKPKCEGKREKSKIESPSVIRYSRRNQDPM